MSVAIPTRAGNSLIYLVRPGTLSSGETIDGNWSCQAALYDGSNTEVVAPWSVTAKYTHDDGEQYFLVEADSAKTTLLSAGTAYLAIEVVNTSVTPKYQVEDKLHLLVSSNLIT